MVRVACMRAAHCWQQAPAVQVVRWHALNALLMSSVARHVWPGTCGQTHDAAGVLGDERSNGTGRTTAGQCQPPTVVTSG